MMPGVRKAREALNKTGIEDKTFKNECNNIIHDKAGKRKSHLLLMGLGKKELL